MDRTAPEQQQDTPTPSDSIPGLDGPSTPETCRREYEDAAARRTGNGGW
ncbi:hypothetical protein RM572_21845 [Streptomyces sp. DSM 42041]|uniref:Uncharacterized protein n=1 Tax=Streptomyces hazeniae TaxID=3075538 RepID=A0ABU2NWN0_9ACTN|nr:hypothetical protein [Streptomyces sp. DSM 42041]MDT0381405.1 hypothetical protein [Streptomyces sp. DSM 42041]